MLPPELALAGIFAGSALALALTGFRIGRIGAAGKAPPALQFDLLPPTDHDRPARLMLADLARSSTLAAVPGPRLLGRDHLAAFGRAICVSSRAIAYRDFANGAWADAHAARLEHFYPGIRVIPREEGSC